METVSNIFLKSDKSFEINEISQVPIVFNNLQYDYFISLLSFSFLNCSPNITGSQILKYTLTDLNDQTTTYTQQIPDGLYDVDDLLNLFNSYFNKIGSDSQQHQYLTFSVDPFNEHITIYFDNSQATLADIKSVEIINIDNCILNNELFRFNLTANLIFDNSNTTFNSPLPFRISTYNNVLLTSSSVPGLVSLYGNDDGITTSSALYVISSVADPFTMIEYTAIQPIDFPINSIPNLSNFQFKLTDENNQDLKLLPNGTPDFSVKLAIKRKKK